jgi:hypothetical protein
MCPWKKLPGVMPTAYALFNRMVLFNLSVTPTVAFMPKKHPANRMTGAVR